MIAWNKLDLLSFLSSFYQKVMNKLSTLTRKSLSICSLLRKCFFFHFRQLKTFRFVSKLFCCSDGPTPRSSAVSEYSNYTDTVDFTRRSPRQSAEHRRKHPRTARFQSKQYNPRLNDLNESSSSTTSVCKKGNNVEMCDFIVITVKRDEKFS